MVEVMLSEGFAAAKVHDQQNIKLLIVYLTITSVMRIYVVFEGAMM